MLAVTLVIISLVLYSLESNMFKDASGGNIHSSSVYYVLHSILLLVLGIPFIKVNLWSSLSDPLMYLLVLTETLSTFGILVVLRDTNATISVAILGVANMSASLLVSLGSWPVILVNVVCISVYCVQSANKLSRQSWIASIFLIFIPSVISANLLTRFTDSYGNAMSLFGLATIIPASIWFLLIFRRLKFTETVPYIQTAGISGIAAAIYFYAFTITEHKAALLIALSFEAVITELVAYMFRDQHNLSLGTKSKLQVASLLIFCLSSGIGITLFENNLV